MANAMLFSILTDETLVLSALPFYILEAWRNNNVVTG